jgi:hypothetical protein
MLDDRHASNGTWFLGFINADGEIDLMACRRLRRSWIGSCRIAADHKKDGCQCHRERSRAVVRYGSLRIGDADDRRAQYKDAAEHKHDSKSARSETELRPDASRPQRKDGHAEAHKKNQPHQQTAHNASLSEVHGAPRCVDPELGRSSCDRFRATSGRHELYRQHLGHTDPK